MRNPVKKHMDKIQRPEVHKDKTKPVREKSVTVVECVECTALFDAEDIGPDGVCYQCEELDRE